MIINESSTNQNVININIKIAEKKKVHLFARFCNWANS